MCIFIYIYICVYMCIYIHICWGVQIITLLLYVYMRVSGCVWLYANEYDYIRLYMIVYGCIWLLMVVSRLLQLLRNTTTRSTFAKRAPSVPSQLKVYTPTRSADQNQSSRGRGELSTGSSFLKHFGWSYSGSYPIVSCFSSNEDVEVGLHPIS